MLTANAVWFVAGYSLTTLFLLVALHFHITARIHRHYSQKFRGMEEDFKQLTDMYKRLHDRIHKSGGQ